MQEQERGIKVIYKGGQYFIDINLTQFYDIKENYPANTPIKIFVKAPFYNINAISNENDGLVPISELTLVWILSVKSKNLMLFI